MKTDLYLGHPYASFILRGKELDPESITKTLGINPSKSFKKGDFRRNNKKWPHGYWELDSSDHIKSNDLLRHIEWIVNNLMNVKRKIRKLSQDVDIKAEISCFWILPKEQDGINLSFQLLEKIVDLGLNIEFDINFVREQ